MLNNPYRKLGIPLRDDSEYGYNSMLEFENFKRYYLIDVHNRYIKRRIANVRRKHIKIRKWVVVILIIVCSAIGGHLWYIGKSKSASFRVLLSTILFCIGMLNKSCMAVVILILISVKISDLVKLVSGNLFTNSGYKV